MREVRLGRVNVRFVTQVALRRGGWPIVAFEAQVVIVVEAEQKMSVKEEASLLRGTRFGI